MTVFRNGGAGNRLFTLWADDSADMQRITEALGPMIDGTAENQIHVKWRPGLSGWFDALGVKLIRGDELWHREAATERRREKDEERI